MSWPPDDGFIVTLGDLLLFGQDAQSVCEFYVIALEGWDGSATKAAAVPRPNDHGSFPPVIYYDDRKLTLYGAIAGTDAASRRRGETRFMSQLAGLQGTTLRVQEAPYDRYLTVYPDGPMAYANGTGGTNPLKSKLTYRFAMPLVAYDPIRYATAGQSVPITLPTSAGLGHGYPYGYPLSYGGGGSGDELIVNSGNVEVWPQLRIDGPVVNPVILNVTTGQQLSLSITLGTGEWLDIDGRNEIVTLDGTASRRNAVQAGSVFPTVPPGTSQWQFRASTSTSALLTVSFNDGWS